MPTGELLFVVGLPGSGKTPYLAQLEAAGSLIFDDYKASAYGNFAHFCAARRYCELLEALRDGRRCVVADMSFCRAVARDEAASVVADAVPGLIPHWEYFRNDPRQCCENIRSGTRSKDSRLAKVAEFSPEYTIPNGARVIEVWREERNRT